MKYRRADWALAVLTTAAFAVRAWRLGSAVLDSDEFFQVYFILKASTVRELMELLRFHPQHVLLDPLSTWLVSRAADGIVWLRFPSVLLGTASVPLLFLLGRRLGGARLGLTAAGLLAFSMIHVEWSRRVNPTAPLVFWTLASSEALLRALQRRGPWRWAGYALCMTAFAYSHPFFAVVGLLHAAGCAAARRGLAGVLAGLAVAGLAYWPWHLRSMAAMAAGRPHRFIEFFGFKPLIYAGQTLLYWGQASERSAYLFPASGRALQVLAAVLYAGLFAWGFWRLRRRGAGAWAILFGGLAGGWAALMVLIWWFSYFFAPRYTLFLLPGFLLVVAFALEELRGRGFGRLRPALLVGAACSFLGVFALDVRAGAATRGWCESLAASTRSGAPAGAAFLFPDPDNAMAFLYYYDRPTFLRALPPVEVQEYWGTYYFRLPPGLSAPGREGSHPVLSLYRPEEPPEERRRRWRSLAAAIRAGRPVSFIDMGMRPPGAAQAMEGFFRETGLGVRSWRAASH